jgi:ClpP class serine protease
MIGLWLLQPETLGLIAEGRRRCTDTAAALAWERAETDALARETARVEGRSAPGSAPGGKVEARDGQLPRGLSVAGATAEIRIEGTLTKRPDFFAAWFGGGNTTYAAIRNALSVAATDPAIKDIVLSIDSPGGSVDGLFETLDALAAVRASGKGLRVRAERATSAAYGLAAAAGKIEASDRAATFGSIGTAISYQLDADVVTLTNTDSPDKRPDLTTPEGKAVVVKYLDQVNDEFVRAIAAGRGVDKKTVTESYGRGAVFTAPLAKELGVIDRIQSQPLRAVSKRGKTMSGTEETTDARAAAASTADAEKRGEERERDRVKAHLKMGETCGDMSIAIEAIRSGAPMTLELQASYMSAGMNRGDAAKRQGETNAAAKTVSGEGESPANATDLGDAVVAQMKRERGFVRG